MKNGKRIVLEASEGVTFRVQEGKDEIVVRAIIEDNIYTSPKIPEGYVHVKGAWYEGFVIKNKVDGSEFVWIPVGWLDDDNSFHKTGYHEEVAADIIESVKKYGGFYFARYHASNENGKLVFKKGNMPWCKINYQDAERLAAHYSQGSKDVKSCITSGEAFDSVLRWIIKSNAKTYDEVVEDSQNWGNYWDEVNDSHCEVMPTGSEERWSVLNIFDIAGNVEEWTSERWKAKFRAVRGGNYDGSGRASPVARRTYSSPDHESDGKSFRAVLYLK